jgi:hypothetical protein
MDNQSHPLRIFILDSPRTNCQAFHKMFYKHPQIDHMKAFHLFAGAGGYGPGRLTLRTRHSEHAEKMLAKWGTDYPQQNSDTYEKSARRLRDVLKEVEDKVFSTMSTPPTVPWN